jgi:hypothetical protein
MYEVVHEILKLIFFCNISVNYICPLQCSLLIEHNDFIGPVTC